MTVPSGMSRAARAGLLAVVVFVVLAAACTGIVNGRPGRTQTIVYAPSGEDFANPERGLTLGKLPPDPVIRWDSCGAGNNFTAYDYTAWTPALTTEELRANRAGGRSLVTMFYHLAEFRNAPLSDAFLARVDHDFAVARETGFKIVPRFAYNYFTGGPDAPLDRVLQHLDQLGPVLQRNADVLAFMELGFIGCWGEMHSSSNQLIGDGSLNDATRLIINKAFAVVPSERMIAVRYAGYEFQFFGNDDFRPIPPLTSVNAFDGSIRARWGQHDDCVVCGEWNWGTWAAANQGPFAIRDFLHADTQWVVQAGQSGTPGPPQPPDVDQDGWTSDYASCRRVLPILEAEHWGAMDAGPAHAWFGAAGGQWQQEGCLDAITTRLGYRFRLTSASLPEHVRQGAPMPLELQLYNDGFAAPYNARAFELVFRNRSSGALTRVPLASDPRRWQPGPVALSLAPTVPRQLAHGEYDVLLAFPDPAPSLHDRPEFAIRLANDGVWDATCGCNSLHASLRVLPGR